MSTPRETPGVFRRPNGFVIHLYLPGYAQGRKARVPVPEGMCAAQAWGAVWLDAVPSVRMLREFRWCGKCIGLALVHFGLHGPAVETVVPRFGVETPTPTQGRREGMGSPDGVADPNELSGGRQQPEELVPVAPTTEERGGVGSAPAPPALVRHDFSRVSVSRDMLEDPGPLIQWMEPGCTCNHRFGTELEHDDMCAAREWSTEA